MDGRTRGLLRDATLALVALGGLLGRLRRTGTSGVLRRPWPAVLGLTGTFALELAMLARPETTRQLWDRPAVQAGATLSVLGLGRLVARRDTRPVAALCWGLVGYLCLVGVVLACGTNPLARLVNR